MRPLTLLSRCQGADWRSSPPDDISKEATEGSFATYMGAKVEGVGQDDRALATKLDALEFGPPAASLQRLCRETRAEARTCLYASMLGM